MQSSLLHRLPPLGYFEFPKKPNRLFLVAGSFFFRSSQAAPPINLQIEISGTSQGQLNRQLNPRPSEPEANKDADRDYGLQSPDHRL